MHPKMPSGDWIERSVDYPMCQFDVYRRLSRDFPLAGELGENQLGSTHLAGALILLGISSGD